MASDWPRTFFTPKVFLFSIYIRSLPSHSSKLDVQIRPVFADSVTYVLEFVCILIKIYVNEESFYI